jgi:arabinose-5-phosphate isomerase
MTDSEHNPKPESPVESGRETLRIEADALLRLAERLNAHFERAVRLMLACKGRVVVTGVGKSGAIARKIAGTLASTGTPALFLHPSEGVHGDLGMVVMGDLLLALSYSGVSDEILAILPAMKRLSVPVIAMTGRLDSPLARYAEVALDVSVEREACPLGLAPTASSTAMLALGDALAVAVMGLRRFSAEDYALLHPAGSLGRRLLLTAGDVMRTNEFCAGVREDAPLVDVLFAITAANAGAANVLDGEGRLAGIITDGDIRRWLLKDERFLTRRAAEVMTRTPRTCHPDQLAAECLGIMQQGVNQQAKRGIGEMPVVDDDRHPLGMLNLKDLLQAGIV